MKQINYFLLLFCLLSHTLDTSAAQAIKKISPNKQKEQQEPLMHMARSVSSDGPPLEGAMRLQRVLISAAVGTIQEEHSDRDEDKSKRRLSVEVDVEAPYTIMRTPSAATRTPKQGAFNFNASATGGGLLTAPHARPRPSPSPRHGGDGVAVVIKTPKSAPLTLPSPKSSPKTATSSRRGSRDSNDDADIKAAIATKIYIMGKDTPNTRKFVRKLVIQQKQTEKEKEQLFASGSVQSIDGETLGDVQHVDIAALAGDDRSDDFPGERGGILASEASEDDIAKPEWTEPLPSFHDDTLTSARCKYLLRLKKAALHYKEGLKSFSVKSYAAASDKDKATALNRMLAPVAYEFYGGKLTDKHTTALGRAIERDLEQANKLGCCAGCCSCCLSGCCVIL